jgi:WD40 repeat protein
MKINKSGTRLYGVMNYEMKIWDVGTAAIISTIPDFWGRVDFAINESQDIVAGSMNNQGIGLWEISNGKWIQKIFSGDEGYRDLNFTPDETKLIASVFNRHYRIWDITKNWCSPP